MPKKRKIIMFDLPPLILITKPKPKPLLPSSEYVGLKRRRKNERRD